MNQFITLILATILAGCSSGTSEGGAFPPPVPQNPIPAPWELLEKDTLGSNNKESHDGRVYSIIYSQRPAHVYSEMLRASRASHGRFILAKSINGRSGDFAIFFTSIHLNRHLRSIEIEKVDCINLNTYSERCRQIVVYAAFSVDGTRGHTFKINHLPLEFTADNWLCEDANDCIWLYGNREAYNGAHNISIYKYDKRTMRFVEFACSELWERSPKPRVLHFLTD